MMSDVVSYQRRGRIGVIIVDSPPVNALSHAVRAGLEQRLAEANADDGAEAIVLTCAGRTFHAGADISEFGKPPQPPHLPELILSFESSPKLTVAAIHGTAFGGGLETAMGCDYRCAIPSAKVGQPEVKLGILPGAGGTQRLPRLAGVPDALRMIVSGDPVKAPKAHEMGVIDEIVEGDLLEGALAYTERLLDEGAPQRKTREIETDRAAVPEDFFDDFRKKIARKTRGYFAPERNIQAVEAAVELPFDEGIKREEELFNDCVMNPQAAALQHVFFAEREAAKIPDVPKDTPLRAIGKVGILGAGTMGGGIAMAFANTGIPVTIVEVEQEPLDRGLAVVKKNYMRSVKSGRFTEEKVEQLLGLITGSLDMNDFADCDLVIEAVFENLALKKEIFGKLDGICKPGAILATNTSGLDVDEIAAVTRRPEDVIGLHFFSPANVMRLLEIVRADKTAKDVLATCVKMAKAIRKVGVVSGVCHGFIGNRMLGGYGREAESMILEGATPAQVDKAMFDFGLPMGPFTMFDLAGVDVGYRVRREAGIEIGSKSSAVGDNLYDQGRHGQKTSAGYYDYKEGSRVPQPSADVEAMIKEVAEKFGVEQREFTDEEIVQRCTYPLINEAARILEEGIALRPSDVDIVWINGYGFPPYRGGPMQFADTEGLKKVYDTIVGFREKYGDHWQPAPLLERLANQGDTFKGWALKKASGG
jgi:3-hydroxyacyl-CoA dehydrogenase